VLSLSSIDAEPIWAFWNQIMFSKNGDEHRRLRQLVHSAYTVGKVQPERASIRGEADRLAQSFDANGSIELLSEFVEPVIAFGICQRAGFDAQDVPRIQSWARGATKIFLGITADDQDEVGAAFEEMFVHLDEIISRRRQNPQTTLMDSLIIAHDEGRLSYEELRAMLGNVVTGGYATTQFALLWLVWYLLNDETTLARVRAEPALIVPALRELLRLEPPVEATFRTAEQDMEMGGCPFHKGDTVMISFLSANRDEAQFDDAEAFDIDRDNPRLLSFGAGPHRCLGANLALAVVEEAATSLLQQVPNLRLADPMPNWSPAEGYREMTSLFVLI